MRSLHQFIWIFAIAVLFSISCRSDDPTPPNNNGEEKPLLVSQFVYDGMSLFYLWNEQMLGREPTATDTDAKRYFESLLYRPTDVWSWITDDVDALLRDFAGESARAFGFAPFGLWINQAELIGVVRYVYPDSPAARAGMKRGDIILEINNRPITLANIDLLLGSTEETTFTIVDIVHQSFHVRERVTLTQEPFVANPVLHSSVHRIDGRVIGYLFYTAFRSNFNEYLFEVFRKFQREGVTDLVLDLRYNPGGAVTAAIYLASLIAPAEDVRRNAVFTIMNYNRTQNAIFDRNGWDRSSRLGEYNADLFSNPIDANLNLDRVHIIATRFSASASELVIFCLDPFMNVVHIGENTSGKYTASWTVHAFDNFFVGEGRNRQARAQIVYENPTDVQRSELRNWAMQPIVGKYTDRDGNSFAAAGTLAPDVEMNVLEFIRDPREWLPIGDRNDYLFSKAISLITGQPHTAATRSASDTQFIEFPLFSPQEMLLRRAVNVDNVEIDPETLRKILRSLR